MEKETSKETSNQDHLYRQIRDDLDSFLSKFSNKSFAIRVLSKESEISEKTIRRILDNQNRPTYDTIYSIYSVMFENENEVELLETVPKIVSAYLKSKTVRKLKKKKNKQEFNFLELFKKDPILCELFIKSALGGISTSATAYRYGQYGIELIEKLVLMNVVKEVEKGIYKITNSAPRIEGELLKFVGLRFSDSFGKPKNSDVTDQNVMSFYATNLNDEGFKEWIRIDTEAFYKKIEVANNKQFKGTKSYFTFNSTDSIE